MGGKHRRLIGGVDRFVDDTLDGFRQAALSLLANQHAFNLDVLEAEQARLDNRIAAFGASDDARDIWHALGVTRNEAEAIPEMSNNAFAKLAGRLQEMRNDAR
jgi:malonate decarboxylase beta subunit